MDQLSYVTHMLNYLGSFHHQRRVSPLDSFQPSPDQKYTNRWAQKKKLRAPFVNTHHLKAEKWHRPFYPRF